MNATLLRLLCALVLMGQVSGAGAKSGTPPIELTQQELDWIKAKPVLRVGVFDSLIPFEYKSAGQLRGLSAKYLQLITQRTGLQFKPVFTSLRSARKKMLVSGEVDILSARRKSEDPSRDVGILYTAPYNSSSAILVSRFGDHSFAELDELAGKRLAMFGLGGAAKQLNEKFPDITVITADSAVEIMDLVKDGFADAVLASEWLLIPYLSRQYQGVLQVTGLLPQLHTGVSMAVRDDDVILMSILQKALASVTGNERKAIYDAWFAEMNLDIPTVERIAEHYEGELWLFLAVVLLLVMLVFQSRGQRRRAMLREQEKAMFLAVMSHEIRSPMNAVLAAVELLQRTSLDEQQRYFTDLAHSGANTLLRLVDSVLDISKMEAGQFKLNPQPVDLLALTRQVVDDHQPYAEKKSLMLTLVGERFIPPMLLDELRLAQVLRNLVANAIKFTEVGWVEVHLQMLEGAAGDVSQVRIQVSDSGIGLSEQAQSALFLPYAKVRRSYKRTGGTGLGLVVCRRLVRLMHGELALTSTLGSGTSVVVTLPVEWATPLAWSDPAREVVPSPAEVAAFRNGLLVLVVADIPADEQVLVQQLHELGCETLVTANITQGLAIFETNRVDMVLLSVDPPSVDSYSSAGAFRDLEHEQRRQYCPIVAVSALPLDNVQLERCFDAGIDGFLSKPISQAKLKQLFELWCNSPLTPQFQTPTEQSTELTGGHAVVRKSISSLLKSVALRDRSQALRAVQQLRGVALTAGWAEITTTVEVIEQLLSDDFNWPAEAIAGQLIILQKQWADLLSSV